MGKGLAVVFEKGGATIHCRSCGSTSKITPVGIVFCAKCEGKGIDFDKGTRRLLCVIDEMGRLQNG